MLFLPKLNVLQSNSIFKDTISQRDHGAALPRALSQPPEWSDGHFFTIKLIQGRPVFRQKTWLTTFLEHFNDNFPEQEASKLTDYSKYPGSFIDLDLFVSSSKLEGSKN